MQAVGPSVYHHEGERIELGCRVRVHWSKRSALCLRCFFGLTEYLRCGCLIETHVLAATANDLKQPQGAERGALTRVFGKVEADLHMTLAGEVIDLVRFALVQETHQA